MHRRYNRTRYFGTCTMHEDTYHVALNQKIKCSNWIGWETRVREREREGEMGAAVKSLMIIYCGRTTQDHCSETSDLHVSCWPIVTGVQHSFYLITAVSHEVPHEMVSSLVEASLHRLLMGQFNALFRSFRFWIWIRTGTQVLDRVGKRCRLQEANEERGLWAIYCTWPIKFGLWGPSKRILGFLASLAQFHKSTIFNYSGLHGITTRQKIIVFQSSNYALHWWSFMLNFIGNIIFFFF